MEYKEGSRLWKINEALKKFRSIFLFGPEYIEPVAPSEAYYYVEREEKRQYARSLRNLRANLDAMSYHTKFESGEGPKGYRAATSTSANVGTARRRAQDNPYSPSPTMAPSESPSPSPEQSISPSDTNHY